MELHGMMSLWTLESRGMPGRQALEPERMMTLCQRMMLVVEVQEMKENMMMMICKTWLERARAVKPPSSPPCSSSLYSSEKRLKRNHIACTTNIQHTSPPPPPKKKKR